MLICLILCPKSIYIDIKLQKSFIFEIFCNVDIDINLLFISIDRFWVRKSKFYSLHEKYKFFYIRYIKYFLRRTHNQE